jgi:parvulin-like peptidyl-prolyl isomerase
MNLENETTVGNTFGKDFLEQLSGLQKGMWVGPVYSSFGTHLVNLSLDKPAQPQDFTEARNTVERDFIRARRESSEENFYQSLRTKYQIKIQNIELQNIE